MKLQLQLNSELIQYYLSLFLSLKEEIDTITAVETGIFYAMSTAFLLDIFHKKQNGNFYGYTFFRF